MLFKEDGECWWLTPVIPATQAASWGKQFMRPYLENTQHKKELVD
jgi:hypothetical protein